jgi:HAD superfamily hydrolase (TIGR01549 family)
MQTATAVRVVFFDIGETLIDESRLWRNWAHYLRIPENEFLAALDEVIRQGQHHHEVLRRFRPDIDIAAVRRERAAQSDTDLFSAADLYPDAVPCMKRLKQLGYQVGIAGNQPEGAVAILGSFGTGADFIASSASLGVEKPSPEFFRKLADMAGVEPHLVAHIGDRLDNDILPARAVGMAAIFLERGPWARVHAKLPDIAKANAKLSSLSGLPDILPSLKGQA